MTTEVFNYTNRRSATVKEYCDGKAFYLEYAKRGESRNLFCYPIIAPVRNSSEVRTERERYIWIQVVISENIHILHLFPGMMFILLLIETFRSVCIIC